MIISHSRKFIFVKTMKTAGTSLEIALSEHCGDRDVLSPLGVPEDEALRTEIAGRGAQNYRYGVRDWLKLDKKRKLLSLFIDYYRSRFTEHLPAARIRDSVGREIWDDYYTFTVVRHPYDRFLSRYFFDLKYIYQSPAKRERADLDWDISSPDEFIRYMTYRVNENWRIYSHGDKCLVDKAVRFENMEEDLAEVSNELGLTNNLHDRMKEIRTKSGTRPRKKAGVDDLLGFRERLAIYLLCRRDFELFGYDPGEDVLDAVREGHRDRRVRQALHA